MFIRFVPFLASIADLPDFQTFEHFGVPLSLPNRPSLWPGSCTAYHVTSGLEYVDDHDVIDFTVSQVQNRHQGSHACLTFQDRKLIIDLEGRHAGFTILHLLSPFGLTSMSNQCTFATYQTYHLESITSLHSQHFMAFASGIL